MTSNQLKQIFTTATDADIDAFLEVFTRYAPKYNLSTTFQENAFLAQVLTEVGTNLRSVRENMNYTPASLKKTFGYFKKNPGEADKYGRTSSHKANQQAIANRAYANRIGNGDIDSGDGWDYRGGGFFQLTGYANYETIAQGMGIVAEPLAKQITDVKYGLLSAMAFWKINGCDKCTHIDEVTRIINRNTSTYGKRKTAYHNVADIMSA